MKVAINTINHQYHIICMQNIYDNQLQHYFSYKNISWDFFILRFNGAPTTNPSISYNYCPHFCDGLPEVPHCFMGQQIWISTIWGHTSFIYFSTVATHMKQAIFFLENTNTIRADSLSFATSTPQQNYQSDNLFHISFKEKWKKLSG